MCAVKLVFILIIVILVIAAFTGIEPFSTWKDTAIAKVSEWWDSIGHTANNTTTAVVPTYATSATRTSTPASSFISEEQNTLSIGEEVVELVNDIRAQRGSSKLSWDDTLYKYSLEHSKAMANKRDLFHSDMNMPYAENAWGGEGSTSWGADTIVDSWMNSPKHRTWLLCPSLKHIAVGVAYSNNGMYASWTFWRNETIQSDWWYQYTPDNPPDWWY
jgi:uncharacterized protein YkwD